jgi:hypothetical protein
MGAGDARRVTKILNKGFLRPSLDNLTNPPRPTVDRFIAVLDPAFGQKIFDIAKAQREMEIGLDRLAAELLAPATIGDTRHPDLAHRIGNALPLRGQHIDLAQFGLHPDDEL